MADLKPADVEKAEFAFEVFKDENRLDMNDLGEMCRALNLNPSLETLEKLGETKKRGEKFISFEEFLSIFSQLKKEIKDQGCYEDFVECLKLYDKEENGKMLLGELHHSLVTLGEKLTENQVDILFEDCLDSENSEGEIEYDPFLKRMCDKAPPIDRKKKPAPKAK